ncbi:hypothetical protein QTP88_016970 [Uroleucon formosanum]
MNWKKYCSVVSDYDQRDNYSVSDKKNTIENGRSNSKLSLEQQAKKMKFRISDPLTNSHHVMLAAQFESNYQK